MARCAGAGGKPGCERMGGGADAGGTGGVPTACGCIMSDRGDRIPNLAKGSVSDALDSERGVCTETYATHLGGGRNLDGSAPLKSVGRFGSELLEEIIG